MGDQPRGHFVSGEIVRTLEGYTSIVNAAAVMPDGSRAISGIVGPDAARVELESGFMWPPFMIAELNNHFWDELLDRMEMQKVIPVVVTISGPTRFGAGEATLHFVIACAVLLLTDQSPPAKRGQSPG
jgi:hypothetical protein